MASPLTIEEMCELAESRGGKCLSTEYLGNKKHLQWECSFGHQWPATPNNVKNLGSWCPHCKFNVGEELVRATLEEAFPDEIFDKTRRELWMEGLELDGYSETLRLAFEYQGKQHYQRVEQFQPDEGDFEAQLERDAKKAERCTDEFITLLIVPFTIKFVRIRAYVRKMLLELGYQISDPTKTDAEFYDSIRAEGPSTERQFAKVVEAVRKKGGICLSEKYLGYRVPLQIQCGQGHVFPATPESLCRSSHQSPRFCPECGGTRKKTDDELKAKVESCGYFLLGVESRQTCGRRMRRFMTVRCPAGHEYDVSWDNFSPKDGIPKKKCGKCHHAALGAAKRNDISAWTEQHGITPIGQYQRAQLDCEWKCAQGHVFTAQLAVMRQKKDFPCIQCKLAKYASDHNLELLTKWTPEIQAATPLSWKCNKCEIVVKISQTSMGRMALPCKRCS